MNHVKKYQSIKVNYDYKNLCIEGPVNYETLKNYIFSESSNFRVQMQTQKFFDLELFLL